MQQYQELGGTQECQELEELRVSGVRRNSEYQELGGTQNIRS